MGGTIRTTRLTDVGEGCVDRLFKNRELGTHNIKICIMIVTDDLSAKVAARKHEVVVRRESARDVQSRLTARCLPESLASRISIHN